MLADWKNGPHPLTYRQAEYTFGLVAAALGKDEPDGLPSAGAAARLRRPARGQHPGRVQGRQQVAGRRLDRPGVLLPAPAARHRRLRRPRGVLGAPQEQPAGTRGRAVLRLLPLGRRHGPRRERAARPRTRPPHDPVVLPPRPRPRLHPRADRDARRRHPARRRPGRLRLLPPDPAALGIPAPPAAAPSSRTSTPTTAAPRAPTHGAVIANGNLYCPAAPRALLELGPLSRAATRRRPRSRREDRRGRPLQARPPHQRRRRRLPPASAPPPRARSAARCGRHRCPGPGPPRDPQPPGDPQACCTQQTITVPPERRRQDPAEARLPVGGLARSYARRSGAERGFATAKDPASNDITRGWCRLMGLAPLMLFTVALLTVRNQRILTAWNARQEENQRRAAAGCPRNPRAPPQDTRRAHVRRTTLTGSPPNRQHQPGHHDSASTPGHRRTRPGTAKGRLRRPQNQPGPSKTTDPARNVRPKCETRPHRNVKTSRVRRQGLEPRTRGLRALEFSIYLLHLYQVVPRRAVSCRWPPRFRGAGAGGCRVVPGHPSEHGAGSAADWFRPIG